MADDATTRLCHCGRHDDSFDETVSEQVLMTDEQDQQFRMSCEVSWYPDRFLAAEGEVVYETDACVGRGAQPCYVPSDGRGNR